jgi:hypothetical protein
MLWPLLLFVCCAGVAMKGTVLEQPAMSSLTIVSVPWDIQTRTALTESTIREISAATTMTLVDTGELREYQALLEGVTAPLADKALADGAIRVLAVGRYGNGTSTRLSIAESCQVMWKDGRAQSFDRNLFRWLVKRLPAPQQSVLADYPSCREAGAAP